MHLWRRLAAPRWLIANGAALRSRAGNQLAIVEWPNRNRLQLEVACKREQGRELITEFGGRLEQLPCDWDKPFVRGPKARPLRIGKRLIVIRTRQDRQKRDASRVPYRGKQLIIPAGA